VKLRGRSYCGDVVVVADRKILFIRILNKQDIFCTYFAKDIGQ
jgi:hypothetical protein